MKTGKEISRKDLKKESKAEPKAVQPKTVRFNHSAPAEKIFVGTMPYVKQNGVLFTNADYDHRVKKWIPEPKPVDLVQDARNRVEGELAEIKKLLATLIMKLEKIAPDLSLAVKG